MSLLNLQNVTLTLGGKCLLEDVTWSLKAGDKIALVGRNGAGKSSLLRLLNREFEPDKGALYGANGLRIGFLSQDIITLSSKWVSVIDVMTSSLGDIGILLKAYHAAVKDNKTLPLSLQQQMDTLNAWEILVRLETCASRLSLDLNADIHTLSGGMRRRVFLARALIDAPDVLMLDEPTNHLDMQTIEWLEGYLKHYSGTVLLITHDRSFLNQVATTILEIDRAKLYTYSCDYETFLERRESRLLAEERQNALFDKKLKEEEIWIRTGIQARRTRNEGRVRALKAMREAYKLRRSPLSTMETIAVDTKRSGEKVLQAEHLYYSLGDKVLLRDFSLLLMRKDKLGIIGPNGCGKTTLLRLLLKELTPTQGTLVHGTALEVAYFDQLRAQLDDTKTVMETVADGNDYVTIAGKSKHIATYLKEFLFSPDRFKDKVLSLSGGERNRLLIAKLLAKPVNLLVMDEPTNDLDIETLELLESQLIEYTGTLILISHDRTFINQVVTSVLAYEGEGVFTEYQGGYDDYKQAVRTKETSVQAAKIKPVKRPKALTYNEQRELTLIPKKIETLEAEILAYQLQMADPLFYQQDALKIGETSKILLESEKELAALYARWMVLENKE